MAEIIKEKKARKPKARDTAVVIGCLEERLSVIADGLNDTGNPHVARLLELCDELRRSLGGRETEESE